MILPMGDLVAVSLFLAALILAAVWVRRWLLPEWQGSAARLAEAVLFCSQLVVLLELVGLAGLFETATLALLGLVIGSLAIWGLTSTQESSGQSTRGSRSAPFIPAPGRALWLAWICAVVVLVAWSGGVASSLHIGIYGQDSMWYHLPLAAGYVQDGQIGGLQITDPMKLVAWFYPQNGELFHGLGMLALGSDFASVFINLGWAGLTLLAGWCLGRRIDRAVEVTLATTLVLITPMLLSQSGNASSDAASLALLFTCVSLLLLSRNEDGKFDTNALAVAGLAAGLAAGTKLTLLLPVAVLLIGLGCLLPAERRFRGMAAFAASGALTGGFWYLRNLVITGNPLPWIGPLPQPDQLDIYPREAHSVAEYLTHPGTWGPEFVPGFDGALGFAWLLIGGLALAGLVAGVLRRGDVLRRTVAISGLLLGLAWFFLPISASGPFGSPSGLASNLRYAAPSILLGLTCLAWSLPSGKRRLSQALQLLLGLGVIVTLIDVMPGSGQAWILALVLLALGLAVWAILKSPLERSQRTIIGLAVVLGSLFVAGAAQSSYLESRYDPNQIPPQDTPGFRSTREWLALQRWASSVEGQKIGVVGPSAVFAQFMFYGGAQNNHVTYVGDPQPHGGMRPSENCRDWRTRVNDLDLDAIVFTPSGEVAASLEPQEAFWTRTDPASRELIRSGPASVFILLREMDPDRCRRADRVKMIPTEWGGLSPVPLETFPPPPDFAFDAFD